MLGNYSQSLFSNEKDSIESDTIFNNAVAFSVDPNGNIFVLDNGNSELVKLRIEGTRVIGIYSYKWTKLAFDQPHDIISPNGLDIYVADYGNHRILRFDRNINLLSMIPADNNGRTGDRQFGYPISVAISRIGKLYILDRDNIRLIKLSSDNIFENTISGVQAGKGRLLNPIKVRISNRDRIFIQDGNSIKLYDIFGNYLTTIGEDIFKHLTSFTVTDSIVWVIDSCNLYHLDFDGRINSSLILQELIKDPSPVIDISAQNGILYFLTRNKLFYKNLNELEIN